MSSTVDCVAQLFSRKVDSPPTHFVIFKNGTVFCENGNTIGLSEEELRSRAIAYLGQAHCNAGTETGDCEVSGPDSRFSEVSVYYVLYPSFPQLLTVLLYDNNNDTTTTGTNPLLTGLNNLAMDQTQLEIINATLAATTTLDNTID
jgi:hypothetical protein